MTDPAVETGMVETVLQLQHATWAAGHNRGGLGRGDGVYLFGADLKAQIVMVHRERSTQTAALVGIRHLDKLNARQGPQQRARLSRHPDVAQVAGIMPGNAGHFSRRRSMRQDVLDAVLHQKWMDVVWNLYV